jgi:hypothetical protein
MQAVLETSAKFSRVLQDSASRGPLGSAILLFSLRARPLASFGAVITILAIAFDPFIQQIVQYPSIPSVDAHKESSLVRSSNFVIEPRSTKWINAVSAGIWSGAERFAQQPPCPSGNCTWEEYPSTGWCSKCHDAISYAKILDCRLDAVILDIDRDGWLYDNDSCLVDFGHGNKFQVLGTRSEEETMESSVLSEFMTRINSSVIFKSAVWSLGLLGDNLTMPLENETYAGITNPIVALGNVNVQRCDETALDKGLCITFAEECALSLCTRQSEPSVVNGTTNNMITNEDFGCLSKVYGERTSEVPNDMKTHCWQAGKPCADLQYTNLTSVLAEDDSHPELDFCSNSIIVHTSPLPVDDGSLAAIMARPTVQGKLLSRLTGDQTAWWSSAHRDVNDAAPTTSSDTMEYINVTGLEPVLAGVAASLTQQALLANTSGKVIETVWTTETVVAVDWPWLIYSATLVLSAIALIALTAHHSHRCGLRIWKSSMLPLLYRTLDPDLLARQPVLHDVSTMTGVAGKAKVTLVETSREDGVVLTQ